MVYNRGRVVGGVPNFSDVYVSRSRRNLTFGVFKIEHHSKVKQRYKTEMTVADKSLTFPCPICGAQPQEKCELNSGAPRFESHRVRRDIAKDTKTVANPKGTIRAQTQKGERSN